MWGRGGDGGDGGGDGGRISSNLQAPIPSRRDNISRSGKPLTPTIDPAYADRSEGSNNRNNI